MKPSLIFDFDGTVANSIDKLFELVNGLAPRYGYAPITYGQFQELRDLPLSKACRILKVPLYKLSKAVPVILAEYGRIIPDLEPCPGIVEALQAIRDKVFALGLVSSNHTENVMGFLEHHRIACFDWVEGTGGLLHKHDSIRKMIKRHGLERDVVIYVGDESRDIKAARKSRVKVVSVTWGLHSEAHLRRFTPDFLARHPQEIVNYVEIFTGGN